MAKSQVLERAGRYWFSISYTAKLLGTIERKIETLACRGDIETEIVGETHWVAESAVTELRRDAAKLRKLLKSAALSRAAKPPQIGSVQSPLGSRGREDQHVLPIADYRLPLRRTSRDPR